MVEDNDLTHYMKRCGELAKEVRSVRRDTAREILSMFHNLAYFAILQPQDGGINSYLWVTYAEPVLDRIDKIEQKYLKD